LWSSGGRRAERCPKDSRDCRRSVSTTSGGLSIDDFLRMVVEQPQKGTIVGRGQSSSPAFELYVAQHSETMQRAIRRCVSNFPSELWCDNGGRSRAPRHYMRSCRRKAFYSFIQISLRKACTTARVLQGPHRSAGGGSEPFGNESFQAQGIREPAGKCAAGRKSSKGIQ